MEILVIGGGVSGLTTGIRLLEAGHTVSIWARDLPPHTTSNVAAAVWYPYKAQPAARVSAWGAVAYRVFGELLAAEGPEATGIRMAEVVNLNETPTPDPIWARSVDNFHHAAPADLPAPFRDAFVLAAPVIDTTIYLDYLLRRARAHGGQVIQRAVGDLADAFAGHAVVVNCTGLGARELVGDRDIYPSRGQVLRVKPNGFQRVVMADDDPREMAYVVPRIHDVVLGGTDDERNESTEPDPAVTAGILERCARICPAFAHVAPEDILSVVCGLRPVRSEVRVEAERVGPERVLIHNYGHGGAGITLSWGCAADVVGLVAAAGAQPHPPGH